MSVPDAAFVVDDDQAVRNSLQCALQVIGVSARLFDSGEAFLSAYDDDWSGPLFVDLQMVGIGGMELLEELARRGTRLRVILITGHGSQESEQEARSKGAVAVLSKPFSIKTLEEVLHA